MRVHIEYLCSKCGFSSILKWRDIDLYDANNNKLKFRESCPHCGCLDALPEVL